MDKLREALRADGTEDPVEKTVRYLLQYPHTLIRSSRLMRRLQVSVAEFQQALDRLDQQDWVPEN